TRSRDSLGTLYCPPKRMIHPSAGCQSSVATTCCQLAASMSQEAADRTPKSGEKRAAAPRGAMLQPRVSRLQLVLTPAVSRALRQLRRALKVDWGERLSNRKGVSPQTWRYVCCREKLNGAASRWLTPALVSKASWRSSVLYARPRSAALAVNAVRCPRRKVRVGTPSRASPRQAAVPAGSSLSLATPARRTSPARARVSTVISGRRLTWVQGGLGLLSSSL